MYDLRPYVELNFEVTPASIMYKLESIHRRLSETYGNIEACSSQNASNSVPSNASPAAMVNGGHTPAVSHCNGSATDQEIADIHARQQSVIKRIELLRSKLDSMLVSQKSSNDTKQGAGNDKGKGKGDKKEKKEKTKEKSPAANSQKSGGAEATGATIGMPLTPMESQLPAPAIGQSIAACAPPTLIDFGNSPVSVDEILSGDQKIDISLSIGANDVNWASALLNVLTNRRKNVSVRSFKHSTNSGTVVPSLTALPFDEHAPVSITVVIKSGDEVGPSVSLGTRKHGPIVGFVAVWKLLGRMGGLYPTETGVFADAATRIDFWLGKATAVARSDAKTKEVAVRDISAFLGRCDFLGAPHGLSLADVVVYGLLCSNPNNHASNLESWLARCRTVGIKACCC